MAAPSRPRRGVRSSGSRVASARDRESVRVLIAHDSVPAGGVGGAEMVVRHLVEGLHGAGHEVALCTRPLPGQPAWQPEAPHHQLPGNRDDLAGIDAVLRDFAPDVIHVHNVQNRLGYAVLPRLEAHAPTLLTLHDVISVAPDRCDVMVTPDGPGPLRMSLAYQLRRYRRRWNPFEKRRKRRAVHAVRRRVAVSDALATFLRANGIRVDGHVHNGVTLPPLPPAETARTRFGVQGPTLLFGGRLSRDKGMSALCRALARLDRSLCLLTPCRAGPALEAFRSQLPPNARLVTPGWLDAAGMADAYAACDAVVVPSLCMDSFPLMVIEAMAAGRAVVASCFGGAVEALERAGLAVNPLDTGALARALEHVLFDADTSRAMGAVGRSRHAAYFSVKRMIDAYLGIYASLL